MVCKDPAPFDEREGGSIEHTMGHKQNRRRTSDKLCYTANARVRKCVRYVSLGHGYSTPEWSVYSVIQIINFSLLFLLRGMQPRRREPSMDVHAFY